MVDTSVLEFLVPDDWGGIFLEEVTQDASDVFVVEDLNCNTLVLDGELGDFANWSIVTDTNVENGPFLTMAVTANVGNKSIFLDNFPSGLTGGWFTIGDNEGDVGTLGVKGSVDGVEGGCGESSSTTGVEASDPIDGIGNVTRGGGKDLVLVGASV